VLVYLTSLGKLLSKLLENIFVYFERGRTFLPGWEGNAKHCISLGYDQEFQEFFSRRI
jgi:hypothetical protein